MDKITAFIKTHKRDIIITAAALAADLAVMLLLPALTMKNGSAAGMMVCFALLFAVEPLFCLAAAIFAGWDLRRRWHIALLPPLTFLLSSPMIFGGNSSDLVVYLIVYTAISITAALFTFLARKYGRDE